MNQVLLIGAGGTGKKIIENYFKVQKFKKSNIAVALIDAHLKGYEGDLPSNASFIRGLQPMQNFNDGFQYHKRVNGDESLSWWPEKQTTMPTTRLFNDGCGAFRPFGKFFTYFYADKIVACIREALGTLTGIGYTGITQAGQDLNIDVYICASLGNGTGGGTFMDLAAITRWIIKEYHAEYNCKIYGVFVPSSVTFDGPGNDRSNKSAQPKQIAANGYAALVELQMEFNRQLGIDHDLSPDHPYKLYMYLDKEHRTINLGDVQTAPYDFAFIIDKISDKGRTYNYRDVVDVAGQAIFAMLNGADKGSRLLDVQIRKRENRFGSLGFVKLKVPTTKLSTSTSINMVLRVLDNAANQQTNPQAYAGLYTIKLPTGESFPNEKELNLEASVDMFIEKVLRIKEANLQGHGSEFNQLFELFTSDMNMAKKQLQSALGGSDLADVGLKELGTKAHALLSQLAMLRSSLPQKWQNKLLGGPNSLWERDPGVAYSDIQLMEDAGIRWLIDHKVSQFISQGAYGQLTIWLRELSRQLQNNLASIKKHELEEQLQGDLQMVDQGALQPLETQVQAIQKETASFFARFNSNKIIELAEDFSSSCETFCDRIIWSIKINAVLDFYNIVINYVNNWASTAQKCAEGLASESNRSFLTNSLRRLQGELQGSYGQRSRIEVYVACGTEMQDQLLNSLEKSDSFNSINILGNEEFLSDLWEYTYVMSQKSERKNISCFQEHLSTSQRRALDNIRSDDFADDMITKCKTNVEKLISSEIVKQCNLAQLLKQEALTVINLYFRNYWTPFTRGMDVNNDEGRKAYETFHSFVPEGSNSHDRINGAFQETESGVRSIENAMNFASEEVVLSRTKQLISSAETLWNLKGVGPNRADVQPMSLVVFNPNSGFGGFVDQLKAQQVQIQDISHPSTPLSEVLFMKATLGATLSEIVQLPKERYREAMLRSTEQRFKGIYDTFSPHITQEAYELGQKYLSEGMNDITVGGEQPQTGKMLLALAQILQGDPNYFGWLKVNNGDVKLLREFPDSTTHFTHIGGTIGPELPRDFFSWLEGRHIKDRERIGEEFASNLKVVLWENLKAWVLPVEDENTGIQGIGLEAAIDILQDEAKECSRKQKDARNPDYKHVWGELSQALKDWIGIVRNCHNGWFSEKTKPECLRDK